jgi:radical SAM-linked protein
LFLRMIINKLNFVFAKRGMMKYISHLDLMRLLTRAMRRARLPLKMTEGFSPHPKLSIKRALKLGLESENEEASILLKEEISPDDFRERLQKELPEGIEIKNVERNFN